MASVTVQTVDATLETAADAVMEKMEETPDEGQNEEKNENELAKPNDQEAPPAISHEGDGQSGSWLPRKKE